MSELDALEQYELDLPPVGSNLGWVSLGKLVITYSGSGHVPHGRFENCLKVLAAPGVETVLACSENTRPTSLQRTAVAKVLRGKKIIVVVDANPITRGIITAIGWLGIPMTSFGWGQTLAAAREAAKGLDGVSPETVHGLLSKLRS